MPQTGQEATSTHKPVTKCPENISEVNYNACVLMQGVNKKNELKMLVEDINPHIIDITEIWANKDISDAELGLTEYVMFRRDQIGRNGGGFILYIKESIEAYEIKLYIVAGNSTLTIGLVYRSPNISKKDNNAIKEVSKGECTIKRGFNHGHIQWKSLESTGGEDRFYF